jgi:hypothetical protein
MAQQKPESIFDKRIVERNLKRNKITQKDYEQYLKSLPDAKGKSIKVLKEEKEEKEEEEKPEA